MGWWVLVGGGGGWEEVAKGRSSWQGGTDGVDSEGDLVVLWLLAWVIMSICCNIPPIR